jgi:hypothetical protein
LCRSLDAIANAIAQPVRSRATAPIAIARSAGSDSTMGMMENGTAFLASVLHTHTSVPIIYARQGVSITCHATRSNIQHESIDSDGIVHRNIFRDYLIKSDAFPFTQMPLDGDMITDDGVMYSVRSATPGDPPWKWSDAGQSLLRIHTVKQ